MLCVGLTGGIGVGKTSVAQLFAKRGAFVLDADKIIHKLLLPKNLVWKQVVSQWGPSILIPGGKNNKSGATFRNCLQECQFIETAYGDTISTS